MVDRKPQQAHNNRLLDIH